MRASLIVSFGRRAAAVLLVLSAASFADLACSSGGNKQGTPGAAGATAGSTGAAGSTAGSTGAAGATAGAAGSAAGSTGAAGATGGSTGTAGATGGSTGTAGATGGSTGTAGSAGGTAGATAGSTGAGGASTLVLPVMRTAAAGATGSVYTLEFGNTKFTVDPAPGGRIIEYSLDGTNVLTNAMVNPSYWGSTFWTAPEGQWMTAAVSTAGSPGMMIVPGFDTLPYPMTVAADNSFSGSGPNLMFANMTFNITKKFSADLARGAINIVYSITNQGTNMMTIGHWEVTRVAPNGLTFFPAAAAGAMPAQIANPGVVNPCVTNMNGTVWLDHSKYVPGTPAQYGKYSTDAGGGWIAHVIPGAAGAGDILLVKAFMQIPVNTAGTGHREVEVYYRQDRSYEEIEDHHSQATFTPQQKIDWPVTWYLRRLPTSVMRTAGNQQLVDYVTNLLK
jgi:hypothetical protein